MKLYEITNNLLEQFDSMEQDGLINQELLDELGQALQEKNTSIIYYLQNQNALLESIKAEIDRLSAYRKSIETKQENFKNYLAYNFDKLGIKKFETPIGVISLRETKAIEIYDESLLDEKYFNTKITKTVSKTKIKEDIEKGVEVQGAKQVINRKVGVK